MKIRFLETELVRLKMERSNNDLKFRDVQDNCRLLEDKIVPKVEQQTKLIFEINKELNTIKKEVDNLPEMFKKEKHLNKKLESERDKAIREMEEAQAMIVKQHKEIIDIEHNQTVKERISGMALYNSNHLQEYIVELKQKIGEMTQSKEEYHKKLENFETETIM